MTFLEIKKFVDDMAKNAIFAAPILYAGYAIGVVTQPNFNNIPAALFVGGLVLFVGVVILLLPSWILDKWQFLREPRTKSEIVQQAARKHGFPVIDIKLTTMEPKDLRGLPDKWE